jgi:hypothetical protein
MKSFGLGKKQQSRTEEAKQQPPTNADLTQLLAGSQKGLDRPFTWNWQTPGDPALYNLTVITHGAQHERKGWNASAIDNGAIGAANWKLIREIDGKRKEMFVMQSSDAYLIQSVIDEILVGGTETPEVAPEPAPDAWINVASNASEQPGAPPAYGGAAPSGGMGSAGTAGGAPGQPDKVGNLRQTPIRNLFEGFISAKATGRLICDTGTVTSEVFFTGGEIVHAKSIHTIYNDRDMTGDKVVIDLLTWTEGDFKFQVGWAAATRTVNTAAADLLAGIINPVPAAASSTTNATADSTFNVMSGTTPGASLGTTSSTTAAPVAPSRIIINPDDFSNVDELIGETFAGLVEPSGMLKYGMFLMLVRTEFARYEISRSPFCVAAIGLETQFGGLNYESLSKVSSCFESAGQPLDVIAAATSTRLFALFPHSSGTTAAASLKLFLNNLRTITLANGIHGSSVQPTIGLCEVPRDGTDFEAVMTHACKLRKAATHERSIGMSVG